MNLLEKDIPNPFGHGLVSRLNPELFDRLEGNENEEGPYEELTWGDDGRYEDVNCDVGPAVSLRSANLFLYESESAYNVILPDNRTRYIYSKSNFTLLMKNIPLLFDLT